MSAASAAAVQPITPPPVPLPSLSDLEDLLYDILAGGADFALPDGTLEAVQTFVHENARSRKSHAEFLAFFESRGLPMRAFAPNLLSLPPLETRAQAAETPELPVIAQAFEPPVLTRVVQRPTQRNAWIATALSGLTLAAVSGLAGFGYFGFSELQRELVALRGEAAQSAAALERLQAENAELRTHVRENAQLQKRIEQQAELLLQAFASPINPNPR